MTTTIATLWGGTAPVDDDDLSVFRGPLHAATDAGYDHARVIHNAMFDRRPALVVGCSGTADVVDSVKLAHEKELLTAVKAGGHSIAGFSSCDGGLVIDISAMRGVWVDVERRRARVQGGATWGDVDRETQAFGLAVPGGAVSTTGVGGLTLGGGIGWLHRKWGLACDSLVAAEVVTADGHVVNASETEHADLFWAIRGGGGNFGIVTSFEFDLYPLGPIVMAAAPIYSADDAGDLLPAWRDWTTNLPDEITTRAVLWSMPESPHLPPPVHNHDVLILAAVYAGDPAVGEQMLDPIRRFGAPLGDLSGQMPYRAFQAAFDPFFPKDELVSYWKSALLPTLDDGIIDLLVKRAATRTSPMTLLHVPLLGGATARVAPTATAFGDRSAPYMLSVDGNWSDPAESPAHIEWVRSCIADAAPYSTGTYLNFGDDDPSELDAAFGANLARLRSVKKQYDPDNLFRLNNNITPTPN